MAAPRPSATRSVNLEFRQPALAILIGVLAAAWTGGITDTGLAAEPETLRVFPAAVPGETGDIGEEHYREPVKGRRQVKRLTNVSVPTITVYRPAEDKDTGTTVIVCPGGGYSILAMDLEGTEVAQWLNSIGVTAVLLKYRVPRRKDRPKHLAPLQDAQRAISLVRSHADKWDLAADRIGILGFSAGGHLSAAASTNAGKRSYDPIDDVDKVSCRPDFTILIYPAYLMDGDKLAAEIRVGADTPPAFLVHAGDDPISSENSVGLYLALKRAKVSSELHIYSGGGHGFGLRPSSHACSKWPQRCEQWLDSRGLLK